MNEKWSGGIKGEKLENEKQEREKGPKLGGNEIVSHNHLFQLSRDNQGSCEGCETKYI